MHFVAHLFQTFEKPFCNELTYYKPSFCNFSWVTGEFSVPTELVCILYAVLSRFALMKLSCKTLAWYLICCKEITIFRCLIFFFSCHTFNEETVWQPNPLLKGVWKLRSRWSGILSQDCFFMCHTTISQTCHSGTTKDKQKKVLRSRGSGMPIEEAMASQFKTDSLPDPLVLFHYMLYNLVCVRHLMPNLKKNSHNYTKN